MRWPRVRITVRRLMIVVATVAVVLFFVREFQDGLPPRFVLRGVPERIERLQPGMSKEQTYEILGLKKSWIWGGTSAKPWIGEGNNHYIHETFCIRPMRIVELNPPNGGSSKLQVLQSSALIQLRFRRDPTFEWRISRVPVQKAPKAEVKPCQLEWAKFSSDFQTVAEMSRPATGGVDRIVESK